MLKKIILSFALLCSTSTLCIAQESGIASGLGSIERFLPSDPNTPDEIKSEIVKFNPRFSYAYRDEGYTWIILTEVQAPLDAWLKEKSPEEARRLWCEKEKASFVAVKLDKDWAVDLFFLCPGNGNVNTEMVSTANGLDSIVVKFTAKSDSHLEGTLQGGDGSCPDKKEMLGYCTLKENFTFVTPVTKRSK